jgi:hypothetical protein
MLDSAADKESMSEVPVRSVEICNEASCNVASLISVAIIVAGNVSIKEEYIAKL